MEHPFHLFAKRVLSLTIFAPFRWEKFYFGSVRSTTTGIGATSNPTMTTVTRITTTKTMATTATTTRISRRTQSNLIHKSTHRTNYGFNRQKGERWLVTSLHVHQSCDNQALHFARWILTNTIPEAHRFSWNAWKPKWQWCAVIMNMNTTSDIDSFCCLLYTVTIFLH